MIKKKIISVIGTAKGKNRAKKAMKTAIIKARKLVNLSRIDRITFKITGDKALTLYQVNNAAESLFKQINDNAKINISAFIDPKYKNYAEVNMLVKAK